MRNIKCFRFDQLSKSFIKCSEDWFVVASQI